MQDFHYNYTKNKYGVKAKILLTDSYSLIYKIEAENVYKDFYEDKDLLDFSNYPKDLKYYYNANNIVLCKIKDGTCGVPIKALVG